MTIKYLAAHRVLHYSFSDETPSFMYFEMFRATYRQLIVEVVLQEYIDRIRNSLSLVCMNKVLAGVSLVK